MATWRGRLGRGLLVAGVAVLAGATVFVDEISHGREIDTEIETDAVVGLLLAATAMLASLAVLRLRDARRRAEGTQQVTEAVRDAHDSAHTTTVLRQLAERARATTGADRAAVAMRAAHDPDWARIEALDGAPPEVRGNRLPAADALAAAEPAPTVDWRALGYDSAAACTGGSAPIAWGGEVRGVLWAARATSGAPFSAGELGVLAGLAGLAALALEQAAVRGSLERAAQAGVEALAAAVDMRDSYTAEHSEEVVELARRVARELGVQGAALSDLEVAARLHDVGKIGVPDEILRKEGPLDPDEWRIVKQHPAWGSQMLARVPELAGVAALVRYEHERWDGQGYPDGLAGEEIPLASRIVFVCDAYHAITSTRPYRAAKSTQAALHELQAHAGSQFDPTAVRALTDVVSGI